jgi:hypothetical protein
VKLAPVVLTVSLAANLALAAVFVFRPPAAPTASNAIHPKTTASKSSTNAAPKTDAAALRAALLEGDAAALEAAGVPAEIARDLALGRAMRRVAERAMAAKSAHSDGRWWRSASSVPGSFEESQRARRDLSDALAAAFGFDPFSFESSNFDFLPADKRAALRQITQDYDEMIAKYGAKGIQLASDREKLKLLRAERERDIAALLTPDELAAYELRTSPSAGMIRARFGDAIETEEDFRTLFALQKAFDEKFARDGMTGRISPETMRARTEAERQLMADMQSALGNDKFAALRRASDADLKNVDALVTRLNLPATTTDQIAAARDAYAAESQRINSDSSLSLQERRAQIQALAQRAKTDVAQTLGAEAADAYGQRSTWLNFLQNGMAYTTNPQDSHAGPMGAFGGQTVFPVPPAGMGGAGGRQVMNFTAASGQTGNAVGAFAVPVFGPPNAENVQITSITVNDMAVSAPAPGSPSTGMVTIRPNPPPSPETTPAAPAPKQ